MSCSRTQHGDLCVSILILVSAETPIFRRTNLTLPYELGSRACTVLHVYHLGLMWCSLFSSVH